MKLAILGTDSDILQLAAAARSARHEIVWLGDARAKDTAPLSSIAPGMVDRGSQWELLLDRAIADAVLIGRGTASNELRAEQVKRLATEGMPLLIVHPFESVLTYYEVDMTRRETGAIVQHFNPLMGHPVVVEAADWVRNGHPTIGPIHQLSCERRVNVAARAEVLAHLSRDVELLATIAGDIRRVTAIGPKGDDASYASLQIQMIAATTPSLRWSAGYANAGAAELEMTLHGEHGIVVIRILDSKNAGPPIWQIETNENGERNNQTLENYDPAHAAINRLAGAVADSDSLVERNLSSTWDAATRAMEVVDAADLSLQKGRTIEVFQQQLTERLAFRGTMAAMGCGLILVAFMVLVGVGILGGVEGLGRRHIVNSWSIVLLVLLAFFLLLQVVPFLAGKSSRSSREPNAKPPNDRNP
jgi:predicted dehydrogenase